MASCQMSRQYIEYACNDSLHHVLNTRWLPLQKEKSESKRAEMQAELTRMEQQIRDEQASRKREKLEKGWKVRVLGHQCSFASRLCAVGCGRCTAMPMAACQCCSGAVALAMSRTKALKHYAHFTLFPTTTPSPRLPFATWLCCSLRRRQQSRKASAPTSSSAATSASASCWPNMRSCRRLGAWTSTWPSGARRMLPRITATCRVGGGSDGPAGTARYMLCSAVQLHVTTQCTHLTTAYSTVAGSSCWS